MELTDEELAVVLSPIPFPNGSWDYQYDAVFDGTQYLTINKPQTITSEWQCFFEIEFKPSAPDGTEIMYSTIDDANLNFDNLGNLDWAGNGINYTAITVIDISVTNTVKIEKKIGGVRVTVNGTPYEQSGTWTDLTWPNYTVGIRNPALTFPYSGTISYFKDCDEIWNFRDESLTGSLGTLAVETGTLTFDPQGDNVPLGAVVIEDGVVKQKQENTSAVFDTTQRLSITKTITLTSDYQCLFDSEYTPLPVHNSEVIYAPDGYRGLILSSDLTAVKFQQIGGVNDTVVGSYNIEVLNSVKLYGKLGSIKCITNGSVFESSYTWPITTWLQYSVGSRSGGLFPYSGTVDFFKDCDETWDFKDESLVGSLGTIPVETGVLGFETVEELVPL